VRALVTGGGGYLGGRIARALRDRGDDVRVFGRGVYPELDRAGIETTRGDLRDAEAVRRACADVDIVFHAGARVGVWGKRRAFHEVNVVGTRNVIDACREQGVARLVFTSSPSVVMGADDLVGADESATYPARYLGAYSETKAIAERAVLAANASDLATIALRPHLIWGPGDPHLIPRIVDRARRGRLARVGDGRNMVDITYVDNAVSAHLQAGNALSPSARCAGRPYFISQGEPVRIWDWIGEVLARLGAPPIRRSLSFRTAYRVGAALELAYRVLGTTREPAMTRFVAVQLAKSHYFSVAAARRDFDYDPAVSTSEGLTRLVEAAQSGAASGVT